jgi:hypothetical protein
LNCGLESKIGFSEDTGSSAWLGLNRTDDAQVALGGGIQHCQSSLVLSGLSYGSIAFFTLTKSSFILFLEIDRHVLQSPARRQSRNLPERPHQLLSDNK